jgi:hypothetical protein
MKTQLTLCISGTLLLVGMSGCEKTLERPMNVVYILADEAMEMLAVMANRLSRLPI